MATAERDSTQEWLLPENARPPLLSELEARIDEAMATAKATESAVVTIGAAAIDAAEQARYAAELAERASAAMLGAGLPPHGGPSIGAVSPATVGSGERPPQDEEGLDNFFERADRLAARLEALLHSSGPGTAKRQ